MSNYLKFEIPIRQLANWFVNLRKAKAEAKIPVRWQPSGSISPWPLSAMTNP